MVINLYASNVGAPEFIKPTTRYEGQISPDSITMCDFNTHWIDHPGKKSTKKPQN
jgi:hypothetical protein